MPKTNNKSEIWILGFLGVLTVVTLYFFAQNPDSSSDPDTEPRVRTTHSANKEGILGYYILLERLGFAPQRFRTPSLEMNLKDVDVLFFLQSHPMIPLQPGEIRGLKQWVRDGGTFVCTKSFLTEIHDTESYEEQSTQEGSLAGPLAKGVKELDGRIAKGERISIDDIIDGYALENEKTHKEFRSLLSQGPAVYIAEIRQGNGRYIALTDTAFLANSNMRSQDHAVLAVNLASYCEHVSRGKTIAFDEYHLGYGRLASGWGLLFHSLWTTPPGWAVLVMTAAAVGYLFLKGKRFGTRRSVIHARRRSKMEYIYSLGATYRAVKANGLTYGLLYAWFRRRITHKLHLPGNAGDDLLAKHIELMNKKGSRQDYCEILKTAGQVAKRKKISTMQLNRQLAQLQKLEMEIDHGRAAGQ